MPSQVDSRLHRYLRVAYDGSESLSPTAEPRRQGRWAIRSPVAVRLAAALLVLVVAAVTVLLLSRSAQVPAAPLAPATQPVTVAPTPSAPATAPTTVGPEGPLLVHVAGAVAAPGVVEVAAGTRVVEAIEAAGGASPDADLDALNLAAPVSDGQQIYVPREGEAAPPVVPGGGAAPGLIDLNTADAAALESLPGIGPALAERIVAHRDEHGRFASVDALTDVSGIGPAILERIRDLVTV